MILKILRDTLFFLLLFLSADVSSARKKPTRKLYLRLFLSYLYLKFFNLEIYRSHARQNSNSGMPMRTNSTASLRSDGSDSEVLNRLEHLKRQLKDKEARLQDHVNRYQAESNAPTNIEVNYRAPPSPSFQRTQSPKFLLNPARHHHRDSPSANGQMRHLLHTDDDIEFRPGYFRDDTVLMKGTNETVGRYDSEYYPPSKRIDSADRIFPTNIEREASRRRYNINPSNFYGQDDSTSVANYELNVSN